MGKEMKQKTLAKIRKHLGFSRKEFAELLEISLPSLKKYLEGDVVIPDKVMAKLQSLMKFEHSDSPLEGKVDFLRIRFKTFDYEAVIRRVLKLEGKPFVSLNHGQYAYDNIVRFNHIKVLYSSKDVDMGVLVELSGQGCRELEYYFEVEQSGRTWEDLLKDCFAFEKKYMALSSDVKHFLKFTRIDIALDERFLKKGNYDLLVLKEKREQGLLRTKSKSFKFIDSDSNGQSSGCSIYFGSRNSPIFLNFYEKDLEQSAKLDLPLEVVHDMYGFKNRYEVRMSDNQSDLFVREWFYQRENPVQKAITIINDKLHVFSKTKGQLHLDHDWYRLMGSYESSKFVVEPQEFIVGEKEYRWYAQIASARKYLEKLESITGERRLKMIDDEAEVSEAKRPELIYLAEQKGIKDFVL